MTLTPRLMAHESVAVGTLYGSLVDALPQLPVVALGKLADAATGRAAVFPGTCWLPAWIVAACQREQARRLPTSKENDGQLSFSLDSCRVGL